MLKKNSMKIVSILLILMLLVTVVATTAVAMPLVAPDGKALLMAGNRSFANEPSTLTLSGGQFAGGQEFTIDAGREFAIELEPGDYRAIWSSPGSELSFGRDFTAVAGEVGVAWIVPEQTQLFGQFTGDQNPNNDTGTQIGQVSRPSADSTDTPYFHPEDTTLLVAGNRGFTDAPSTLTISGGQFAGGQEFTVNPGQEIQLIIEPGDYRFTWSSPASERSFDGEFTFVAGQTVIGWIAPHETRVLFQTPGEEPIELR